MKKLALAVMALVLLAGLGGNAAAEKNPLGKAIAPLFNDRQKIQEASHTAWQTARDESPRVAMEKASAHLQKATAPENMIPAQAAPEAFAAWWYIVAAQYWSEINAQKPGGEEIARAIEPIKKARQDLEMALGWEAKEIDRNLREGYRIMQGYK